MHDINFIRNFPEEFDKALQKRGFEKQADYILSLDKKIREFKAQTDNLLQEKNQIAKAIGKARASGEDISELMLRAEQIKENIQQNDEISEKKELEHILLTLPNILDHDIIFGESEVDNQIVRKNGEIKEFSFPLKDHTQIGLENDLIDFDRAVNISGARFAYLKGTIAKLERVLADYMLNILTTENSFLELSPPHLVKSATLLATGQLPKFAEDCYDTKDDLWLIPTSEVSLVAYVKDQILAAEELPLNLCAYTPCYRREAGAAGKDTKGIIRMHQFSKVEMVTICKEDDSEQKLEQITNIAEQMLQRLDLPYQLVQLCSKDTGFSAAKTYDLEVWLPSQNAYREISSCSNFKSFQGRRLKARYKEGKNKKILHTLNGSALAVGRTIVAILENYQNKDGTVTIPEVLRSYFPGENIF